MTDEKRPGEQLSDEQWRMVREFLVEMAEGKTCPHCHQPIEKKEQRGRCVYALPCGHRLYQGKLQ